MDLVFFGIQGSGKGTQARLLLQNFPFYYFEAGQELRTIIASGTPLGKEVSSYVDQGQLVPFAIIITVMKEAIAKVPASQPILFDGIPRDHDQMVEFNRLMNEFNRSFHCIHFMLPKDEAEQRIAKRAVEQGRIDDADEQKVQKRISWFYEKNMPVIDHYAAQGMVTEIDASQSVEDIQNQLTIITQSFTS